VGVSLGLWDFMPVGVQSRVIVEEHLVLAFPSSHPLAAKDAMP
jgi:hypothetical protein